MSEPAGKRPVILFVHTDSDDREMYSEYLRLHGLDVTEVGTTDGALPLVEKADAVVTGLLVRGTMDSVDFIALVRQRRAAMPIVVVTACMFDGRVGRAERAGADAVLLKPCLPDTLLAAVRAAMDGTRVRLVPKDDRRAQDDRRAEWRGGRREADWVRGGPSSLEALKTQRDDSDA